MILDSSALVCLALGEAQAPRLMAAFNRYTQRGIAAPSLLETAMVLTSRLGDVGVQEAEVLVRDWSVEVMPFTDEHRAAAVQAFLRFGKDSRVNKLGFDEI